MWSVVQALRQPSRSAVSAAAAIASVLAPRGMVGRMTAACMASMVIAVGTNCLACRRRGGTIPRLRPASRSSSSAGDLTGVRRAVVRVAVVHQDVRLAGLVRPARRSAAPIPRARPGRRGSGTARPSGCPVASQVAARRPWKRTTASSGDVAATTGGRLLLKPCGPSTTTSGMALSVRKRSVRSAFFSLNQLPWRNSTAIVSPARRSFASRIAARLSDDGKNQRGYCSRIEPSWPPARSGSRPSRNSPPDLVGQLGRQVAVVEPGLRGELLRKRRADLLRQPLRLGRLAGQQGVGLDVEREVRRRAGDPELGHPRHRQGVVRRVDLDQRELAGVVLEALLGRVRARRGRRRRPPSSSGRSTTPSQPGSGGDPASRSAPRRPPPGSPHEHRRRPGRGRGPRRGRRLGRPCRAS